jgi:hypothetical protein
MHPPEFHSSQLLSDWPDCFLEIHCGKCGKSQVSPIKLLLRERADMRLLDMVKRFRCQRCRVPASPVFLCASHHRRFMGGPPGDWALEVVPPSNWKDWQG